MGSALVYLAGSYAAKDALRVVRSKINALGGFRVISSWLNESGKGNWEQLTPEERTTMALRDVAEVEQSDVFFLCTLQPSTGGGYDVELGVALATGAVTYRVGPARNGFHELVMYKVPDWESLYKRLKRW